MGLKKLADTPALRLIESRDHERDLTGLSAQLGDVDAAVRRWAARDLSAHPDAVPALAARLGVEPDPGVRSALFNSLARLGGDSVVTSLLPLLRSEDPGLRNGTIEVLSGLPEAVAPHIETLLADADSDVRIFTVNLLGDLRHARVAHWLAQVLLHDPAVNVVGSALDVLAEVGTAESLPALRCAARRFGDNAFIAFAVDLATGRIDKS